MNLLDYPAGAVIFQAGDPATRAFLIREGTVELLGGPVDSLVRLARLKAGEVFGEMSLIEERPHSLTARAVGAVQLSGLTRSEFERTLTADPATFRIYLKSLFERLRTLSSQIAAVTSETSSGVRDIAVTIHPLTRRAAATLPHEGLIVDKFPFRIGRAAAEDEDIPLDFNDLWLNDHSPLNVSRNHASLEREGDKVLLKDRGSSLGISVNDVHIGGKSVDRQIELEEGDNVVILGGSMSPFQFRIHVAHNSATAHT
jgi:CRP-like cAMP-binding protein